MGVRRLGCAPRSLRTFRQQTQPGPVEWPLQGSRKPLNEKRGHRSSDRTLNAGDRGSVVIAGVPPPLLHHAEFLLDYLVLAPTHMSLDRNQGVEIDDCEEPIGKQG